MIVAVSIRSLDDKDKRIIELVRTGHRVKEVAPIVYLSHQAVSYRLSVMKKHFNCKTTAELVIHLKSEGLV
jgi:DNA-binding NarL/FixJ family response regulator